MSGQYDGKVAFVTGAATGIGRETALAFAEAGARVAVVDWNAVAGEETCHAVAARGGEALFLRCDVAQTDQVADAVAKTVERFGRIDCAFNNAGVAARGVPVHEMSEADWDRTVGINLKGVWACLKYQCGQMLAQGGGAIVNTSSIMGVASGPGLAAYSGSKSGVIGLTKAVALDYARLGIRVNAVCPGGIGETGITSAAENLADMAALAQATPMGKLGEPRDIAEAVLWLCSPAAKFVTGQALVIDGGFTVW
ncbi:glucose 1-dehydrogenase [Sphingomonas jatrophae]|uniref:NAD(P)-dependent dehydrogenase, short-chain alcohol dehydrogenase family n=1 Tax=Sphingomonas jatrophae TaxID=1166337 RepID=A0A1I6KGI2_9SPHN|nr:glucose 1-dehydrogenase [Sphingomonas jatrophae]SFR90264.1 NAD(P)-dependent dehydrogenase, short-chain alcohol dehydrogenase family [Sphingomonas jatrophae]